MDKFSLNFKEPSVCDIILISSDKIHFRIPAINLKCNSTTFSDMITACGEHNESVIELTEESNVLEIVLPYVMNKSCNRFKLDLGSGGQIIIALHKYQIHRGLDDVTAFFKCHLSRNIGDESGNAVEYLEAYCFAHIVDDKELALQAFERAGSLSWEDILILKKHMSCDLLARSKFILAWYHRSAQASDAFSKVRFYFCGCDSNRTLIETWCSVAALSSKWAIEDVKTRHSIILKATCKAKGFTGRCSRGFEIACDNYSHRLTELQKSDDIEDSSDD